MEIFICYSNHSTVLRSLDI